jgi:hypothetical protein
VNRGRLSQRLLMPIHRVPQLLAIPADGEREGNEDRYAYRRDEPSDRACQQEELLDYAGTLPQGSVGITVALGPEAPHVGTLLLSTTAGVLLTARRGRARAAQGWSLSNVGDAKGDEHPDRSVMCFELPMPGKANCFGVDDG